MKKVLITGASGFLGRHALEAMPTDQWPEIHAVSRNAKPGRDSQGVQWHRADLLSAHDIAGLMQDIRPTHLLHLAWETSPGQYVDSPQNERWSKMGEDLVRNFHQYGGQRVVVVGTCMEYDWDIQEDFVEDQTPLRPGYRYGQSKRELFLALEEYAKDHGLELAWARVFFVYGPYEQEKRLVASCIQALVHDREFVCRQGHLIRDYLHARDVGEALSLVLLSAIQGPVNIASGQGISLGHLIEKIAITIGKEKLIRIDNPEGPSKSGDRVVGSNNRLKGLQGWSPRYSLEQGLKNTIDWWSR